MNLHGWDTAFALDLARVNDALARGNDALLIDFAVDDPDGLQIRAGGSFGHWQIAEGGSGQFVTLRLPIIEGWLELTAQEAHRVDLTGLVFVASVALDLVSSEASEVRDLCFDISKAGTIGQDPTPGAITPIRIDDPDHRLDDVETALLAAGLAGDLAARSEQISFVFATVNLVPPASESWLTPVRSAFAYADRSDGSGGALVILSVTSDRTITDLPRSVDPALLASEHEAAFAFSTALLLEHVIMPALPDAFGHGASAASFYYDAASGRVVNTTTLDMASVREGLIDYYPKIRTISFGVSGSGLDVDVAQGTCDLKLGISMTFSVRSVNKIGFDAASKGLVFRPDDSPESHHSADIPWWFWIGGPLVRLIVEVVVRVIANGLAGSLTSAMKNVLSPAQNPPTSIQWRDTADLEIATAWVDGNFVMQGDFARTGDL